MWNQDGEADKAWTESGYENISVSTPQAAHIWKLELYFIVNEFPETLKH